jgi:hypothetical protein
MIFARSPQELAAAPTVHDLVIAGQSFEVTLSEEACECWRWRIAAPGGLALSGAAASELQALDAACRAGRVLAERGAA